jgi:hypothetical protein
VFDAARFHLLPCNPASITVLIGPALHLVCRLPSWPTKPSQKGTFASAGKARRALVVAYWYKP